METSKKEKLFIDGNGYDVYRGDTVYVVLFTPLRFKIDQMSALEYWTNIDTYGVLMNQSLCKGVYKNPEKAEEYCADANAGLRAEITTSFFNTVAN